MSEPSGDSFRTKTLSERIAAALPAGGRFARAAPSGSSRSSRGGCRPAAAGLRSVLPGGEVVLVVAGVPAHHLEPGRVRRLSRRGPTG